jgi:hypothetical protein
MVKLSYAKMNSRDFFNALSRLSQERGFADFGTSYNVSKLVRRIQKELKVAADEHQKILKQYCHLDEKGRPKFKEDGKTWDIKEDVQDDYDKAMEEFLAFEVEFDVHPLDTRKIGSVKLSPADCITLDEIFDPAALSALQGGAEGPMIEVAK